jgi:hypothetical protein
MRTQVPLIRHILPLFIFITVCFSSNAQSVSLFNGKYELGFNLGPSFFLGDLGGTRGKGKPFVKDVNFPFTKFLKGIYAGYYPAEWIGFRLAANIGSLEADDAAIKTTGKDEMERRKRNLKFKSSLAEAYLAMEIYPTVFLEQYDGLQYKFRPYGMIGIGMFRFNPKGEYIAPNGDTKWVELQPLSLEGQGMSQYPTREKYKLTQLNIPMGFGMKYFLKENMYIGLEILHRKTFTDYIDDVSTKYIDPALFSSYLSAEQATYARQLMYRENFFNPNVNRRYINYQRGDPTENDAYFSGLIRLGWRMNGDNTPNGRAKRQLKCPVYF